MLTFSNKEEIILNINDNEDVNILNYKDESDNKIKYLKNNLFIDNIYTVFNYDNNLSMSSENSDTSIIDEKYFEKYEQINEVKVNLFFILSKEFRLNTKNYSGFLSKGNKIKTKRLVFQKFKIVDENKIEFEPKKYIFLPVKDANLIFTYNNDTIKVIRTKVGKNYKTTMKINNQDLLNEQSLKSQYGFMINEETNEIIRVNNFSHLDQSSDRNSINSKSFSSKDDSDKEILGEKFYQVIKDNNYVRYLFYIPEKEIDGIYDEHKEINLKISKKVDLFEGIENMEKNKKNNIKIDNDLQCEIIFKNFESNIIKENEPIILEVKKGFNLIEILNQIKESSKILGNIENKNNLNLPKTIIGILCSDNQGNYSGQINKLKSLYKKTEDSYLTHITKIINNYNINVIIGVNLNSTILEYPLDVEDYNIPNEKLCYRVDIEYANKKMKTNKTKEELKELKALFEKKFQSLNFIGKYR